MVIPVFDGEIDAYWWILCTEKYFKQWCTPETMKMIVVALAMKGPSLTWWLRWYPQHPSVNWDAFTAIFLWYFKPEWRVILPSPDDEEDLKFELQPSTQGASVGEQSTIVEEGINDFNYSPSLVDANSDFAFSIKDSLVQTATLSKNPFNNESRHLFSEPTKQDDDNMAQNSTQLVSPWPLENALASDLPPPKPPEAYNVERTTSSPKTIITITESFEDQSIIDDYSIEQFAHTESLMRIQGQPPKKEVNLPQFDLKFSTEMTLLLSPKIVKSQLRKPQDALSFSGQQGATNLQWLKLLLMSSTNTRTSHARRNITTKSFLRNSPYWTDSIMANLLPPPEPPDTPPLALPALQISVGYPFTKKTTYQVIHTPISSTVWLVYWLHYSDCLQYSGLELELNFSNLVDSFPSHNSLGVTHVCDSSGLYPIFELFCDGSGWFCYQSCTSNFEEDISLRVFDPGIWFETANFKLIQANYSTKSVNVACYMIACRLWTCHSLYILVDHKHHMVYPIGHPCEMNLLHEIVFHLWVTTNAMHSINPKKSISMYISSYVGKLTFTKVFLVPKEKFNVLGLNTPNVLAYVHATCEVLTIMIIFSKILNPRLINGTTYNESCFGHCGNNFDGLCPCVTLTWDHKAIYALDLSKNGHTLVVSVDRASVIRRNDYSFVLWFSTLGNAHDILYPIEVQCSSPLDIGDNLHKIMHVTPSPITTIVLLLTSNKSQQMHSQVEDIVDHNECVKEALLHMGASSKLVVFFNLEDKIIFRGVGNDMIHVIFVQRLLKKILDNEETIGGIKVVEVQMPRNTRHEKISRLWCSCNSGNNKFLVYDYVPKENLTEMLNILKRLLDWATMCKIVIDVAKRLTYLHHNCVRTVHNDIRVNIFLNGEFEAKAFGFEITLVKNVANSIYVMMECYSYIESVEIGKGKPWGRGGLLNACTTIGSSQFKQWDPGKCALGAIFTTLRTRLLLMG